MMVDLIQPGEFTSQIYGNIRDGDYASAVNILEVRRRRLQYHRVFEYHHYPIFLIHNINLSSNFV
jgi:hypothetical protein